MRSNAWPDPQQLQLLKASLCEADLALQAWKQWRDHVDFDQIDFASYKLLGLAAKNPALQSLQDPIFEKCKGVYRRTWLSNQLLWKQISELLLKIGQPPVLLLKGMAMILSIYRNFGVRVVGDVDILVRKESLAAITSFLIQSGWEPNVARFDVTNEEYLKRWHALNFTHSAGFHLDVHWSFIQENSPALDQAVFDQAISIQSPLFFVPDATALLLQTCVHGMKYSPVPLIRWVADAVTLLREPGIKWNRLIELATLAHVCRPLYSALSYLKQEFAVPIPDEALRNLKTSPSLRFELKEYRLHLKGYPELANWYRYCLNRSLFTFRKQTTHIHKYLQTTARLKSPWHIPFYAIYWIGKRLCRKARAFFNCA